LLRWADEPAWTSCARIGPNWFHLDPLVPIRASSAVLSSVEQ
jgi:hypothetical protein